ncbi:MAG: hypothetical protein LBR50_07515 [Tannerella sp.]|jgi:hypothetical protein|nr:hypothetical protein [Tannerella sp.]
MYRQVFTPTETNSAPPSLTVPREWFGRQVEIIMFPIELTVNGKEKKPKKDILKYFGTWQSDKSAEEIISEVYESRSTGNTRILETL